MKRFEKNNQTRQKIITNALQEFSEKSYSQASLNTICSSGNLSKGIIYHYFKDKDELYLACVKDCFDALTDYLSNLVMGKDIPIDQAMEMYFEARIKFFSEYPTYLGIFCSAVMNPPAHLLYRIDETKKAFDELAISILTTILDTVNLRSDVTVSEVVGIFREYQDFVNTRFQLKTNSENELSEHEKKCCRSLQVLLYGVIARGGNKE